MGEFRYLTNAPIQEALVDVRVPEIPSFGPNVRPQLERLLKAAYPSVNEQRQFEAKFELRAGTPMRPEVPDPVFRGYFFKTADEKTVAQFRLDGFTLNRLKPYTSWDDVKPEALRLWRIYAELAQPREIHRVALRYINRLEVPAKGRLEDIIAFRPTTFPGSSGELANFALRVGSRNLDTGMISNIAMHLAPDVPSQRAILMFDIDVSNEAVRPPGPDGLSQLLDQLRVAKNSIFFQSLTDRTLSQYQ